jgi:hypothetical protein
MCVWGEGEGRSSRDGDLGSSIWRSFAAEVNRPMEI